MHVHNIIIFLKSHIILITIWITLLIIILYIFINDWIYKLDTISNNHAIFLINKKNATIIDIRNYSDYLSGYIIRSINISIENIKDNNFSELKKFKKNPLIIINYNGILSNSIIKKFKKIGFNEIYILDGGIISWKSANLPLLSKK